MNSHLQRQIGNMKYQQFEKEVEKLKKRASKINKLSKNWIIIVSTRIGYNRNKEKI